MRRVLPVSLLTLALGACAPSFNPPPDYQGGFLWEAGRSRTVVVAPGDTLYAISRRYEVPVRAIISRNGLTPPYNIQPGQELQVDPVRTHRVMAGETLYRIANSYNVPQSLIVEANEMAPPYTVYDGQTLWIPDPFTVAAAEPIALPPAGAGTASPAVVGTPSRPSSGAIIATNLPPPPGATALPGSPGAPTMVPPPGDAPVIINKPQPDAFTLTNPPQPTPEAVPPVPMSAPAVPQSAPVIANPPQPTPPADVAPVAPQTAAVPPVLPPAAATAAGAVKFAWPVKGRLISGFGPAGKGLHNDGINIAAPLGTQIRAVGAGTVAYAGSELKGFGNLLLIKHDDGLTTAYAHADKLLVAKGDVVKQGQVIATVGKTGNVDAPQLHFEVRRGTQAVDPQQYLKQ